MDKAEKERKKANKKRREGVLAAMAPAAAV
jgi:hypothetical protein